MAALLRLAVPDLAPRLDSSSLTRIDSTLIPEDLRKIVEDVLCEGLIDGDAEANWHAWLPFAFQFASQRRDREERDSMVEMAKKVLGEDDPGMIETIADAWRNEGLIKGREEGRLEGSRLLLARQIALRFPQQDKDEVRQRLEDIHDVVRLEALAERLVTGQPGWDELWA